ncbi:MAG: rod shape-determining protein MreD [Anaerovoracaceae bacterium]
MSYKKCTVMFLIALILQLSLVNVISVFGIVPNLILCLVLIFSFLYDDGIKCLGFAVASGLILDIVSAKYLGISSLSYIFVILLVLIIRRIITIDSIVSPIAVSVCGTLLFNSIVWIVMGILGSWTGIFVMFKFQIMSILLNTIIVMIMYLIMVRRAVWYNRDR